jgi:hypothetical protein
MRPWYVTVEADIPYPWKKTFTIYKSTPDAAASQAVKLFRKAVKEAKGKSKKLDEIRIKIVRGRSIKEEES